MKNRFFTLFFIIAIFCVLIMSQFVLAVSIRSNPQFTQFGSSSGFYGSSGDFDKSMCEAGQDFIVQIAPFGCTPAVVRSDLLEEQNVPVFCQLAATKVNPLIDVEAIEHISFSGKYPKEVSGIGFQPARAALGGGGINLNSPVLNNIGYAVIILKKQKNTSAMPDFVEGTLTTKIRYDIKNAFGVGKAVFYLPELNDNEWSQKINQYGFWNGRGFLRVQGIDESGTSVSVYSDKNNLVKTVNLAKGETSDTIYLPGFDCLAGLEVKLNSLEAPDTKAKLKINSEVVEVADGERFLENKCVVRDLVKQGLTQKILINCQDDEKRRNIPLIISPKIKLEINGIDGEYNVGDYLYKDEDSYVYLGYIGTLKNSGELEDLYIHLLLMPQKRDKLTEKEISYVSTIANKYQYTKPTSVGVVDVPFNILKAYTGIGTEIYKWIAEGIKIKSLSYGKGTNLKILGFVGAINSEVSETTKYGKEFNEYYENAMEDYETIVNSFAGTKENDNDRITFDERALFEEIDLADKTGQKKTMVELCDEFKQNYPNSNLDISKCDSDYKISNSEISTADVLINGRVKMISFEGIYEPTYEEYGAEVFVEGPNGHTQTFNLRKNEPVYLNEFRDGDKVKNEYIELISLRKNSAKLRVKIVEGMLKEIGKLAFIPNTQILEEGIPSSFGSGYTFNLRKINLDNIAKVSVIPKVNNAGTEANFSFKVGIEQRTIKLSPDKTKEKIKDLNDTIEDWEGNLEDIGEVVEGMKTACLGVGTWLLIKNFLVNTGAGDTRQKLMNDDNGWYKKCDEMIKKGKYTSRDICLAKESKNIDADFKEMQKIRKKQNEDIKKLQKPYEKEKFLQTTVDTESFEKDYIDSPTFSNEIYESYSYEGETQVRETIKIGDEDVKVYDITNMISNETLSIAEARELQLNARLMNAESETLQEMGKKNMEKQLTDIYVTNKEQAELKNILTDISSKEGLKNIGVTTYGDKDSIIGHYNGKGKTSSNGFGEIPGDSNVQLITYRGQKHLVELKNTKGREYIIENVYDINGVKLDDSIQTQIKTKFPKFVTYDEKSYQNKYNNPKVKYYDTGKSKGMPAIVPFDIENGWYAATKEVGGFDASGRVKFFYLGNVGENKNQEFFSAGHGDDFVTTINLGSGTSYNQIYGLSAAQAKQKVDQAVKAIQEAARKYKSGISSIKINGKTIPVGTPAVNTPATQCYDFASPDDCNLLFNVCDPVICPSSRCDLGGKYPVKDVIQSGIIGSILLCLPNFGMPSDGGVIIPVCLSGIHAGIDGLLSVFTSYRDCLQKSLDTGEMVGICDEIYSLHLCEFFWRQIVPFVDVVVPAIVEFITGENVRGGGEYLNVKSAWGTADKSINYFTNYYAANSFKAFKARTTEQVGGEICKNYVSGVYPDSSNLLDTFTKPDSPPQFHGRFDEIPFSSTTVPPISHYKVFYHIYAGKDSRASYKVYLTGADGGSYYQDTSVDRLVDSGYIATGEYVSETKDFTAPAGYKKLCINVNGQEECGFKQVSTAFSLNYLEDKYMEEQAIKTDITTEKACISGSPSLYSLLSPNLQEGAEELINPKIYNRGIIRICATDNPGKGTDASAGTNESRWKSVGYCDNKKMKCWLDTQSVKNVIEHTEIEKEVLDTVSENMMKVLKNEQGYLNSTEFNSKIKGIEEKEDSEEKIELINEIYEKVFLNKQKAHLLFLRGRAYGDLAWDKYIDVQEEILSKVKPEWEKEIETVGEEGEPAEVEGEEELRDKWNWDYAIEKVETLKGKYSDNKKFVDELHTDGLLTDKEWDTIRGKGWGFEKDMNYVKKILLAGEIAEEAAAEEAKFTYKISDIEHKQEGSKITLSFEETCKEIDYEIKVGGEEYFPATSSDYDTFGALSKVKMSFKIDKSMAGKICSIKFFCQDENEETKSEKEKSFTIEDF